AESENEFASSTPTSEHGPDPSSNQAASGRLTVPRRRWRTAPKLLKIAPWTRSVPTAGFGSKPKIRISIGVIRLPPPLPRMPTRTPTRKPASTNCQVIPPAPSVVWARWAVSGKDAGRPDGQYHRGNRGHRLTPSSASTRRHACRRDDLGSTQVAFPG